MIIEAMQDLESIDEKTMKEEAEIITQIFGFRYYIIKNWVLCDEDDGKLRFYILTNSGWYFTDSQSIRNIIMTATVEAQENDEKLPAFRFTEVRSKNTGNRYYSCYPYQEV